MRNFLEINLGQLMITAGPVMVPMVICSIVALTLIIEKFLYFSSLEMDLAQFKNEVFGLVKKNNIQEALQVCDRHTTPVAKLFKAGISKYGSPREIIKEQMEEVSVTEIPKLESRLSILATITQIAPLLGILGTVVGMVICFRTIEIKTAGLNPVTATDLSGGIWQALLTSAAGLIIAIPVHIAYNYFVSRVNTIVSEMEQSATELLNLLSHLNEPQE